MKKPRARAAKGGGRAASPRSRAGGRASTRARRWLSARALLDGWAFAPFAVWMLGQLESRIWLGALTAELHFQLALALLLAALVAGGLKRWLRSAAWLVCSLLFFLPLWPVWRSVHLTPFKGGPTLRVAQAHLAGAALTAAQLASWLGQSRFDVVSTTGLGAAQRHLLGKGVVGYSTLPGHEPDALLFARDTLAPRRRPDAHVSLRVGHCDLDITQVNAASLLSPSAARTRSRQMRALLASDERKRSLYIGTLGSRSAAQDLSAFMAKQGLRDVRLGHGRLATGPALLGPLGLPLDQILVRGWIAVANADVSPAMVPGAHRTLYATLQLTEPRCR